MTLWTRTLSGVRWAYRATMSQLSSTLGNAGGYAAAKWDRFTKARPWQLNTSENAIPVDQFPRLRSDGWRFWRDNPYFRKMCRNLVSKVVGNGMTPCSGAMKRTKEGDVPATAFRLRAQQAWREQSRGIDFTGLPGFGGETQAGMEQTALLQAILSGELLHTIKPIDGREQRRRRLPAPVTVQLIDCARLCEDVLPYDIPEDHFIYRGIQFNSQMKRVRYWLYDFVPGVDHVGEYSATARPYPADEIAHVFLKDDIDQLRGTSWFAPLILPGRDANDLQYNFLKTTAMGSCVIGGYRLAAGKTRFGQQGSSSDDLTDDNGNVINRMSPGMLINLGKDGDLKGFSPNLNLAGMEAYFQHILRGIAGGLAGTKSSTVTGDYRGSSFSSERSADNDIWPEIEILQKWFADHYCQIVYEAVIIAAVNDGYFGDIVTPAEFKADMANYLRCDWQGPVARSINPVDDVQAAALRIKSGISTPQIEAAKLGLRIEDILRAVKDFTDQAEQAQLPEIYVNNVLGFDTQDVLSTEETKQAAANGGGNVGKS